MVHACWKSWVFSRRLKVLSDSSGARSEGGRRGRTPRSSAGQWKSELWAREGFQSLQSAIDAFPRLKWPECTDRHGNAALCRVDISTPELLSWRWCAGELEASEVLQELVRCGHTAERRLPNEQARAAVTAGDGCEHQPRQLRARDAMAVISLPAQHHEMGISASSICRTTVQRRRTLLSFTYSTGCCLSEQQTLFRYCLFRYSSI